MDNTAIALYKSMPYCIKLNANALELRLFCLEPPGKIVTMKNSMKIHHYKLEPKSS